MKTRQTMQKGSVCNKHLVNRLHGMSTGFLNLHKVSVDKIVDNREQPHKARE